MYHDKWAEFVLSEYKEQGLIYNERVGRLAVLRSKIENEEIAN